jgi:sulfur relay (sulfurtransferase) DsrC/TusE family protein
MNILKNNKRIASKKIHLLADTIMETSITAAWLLSEDAKKSLILSSDWSESTIEELNCEERVELNHTAAYVIAMETWVKGYYSDFDVIPQSLAMYFFGWGVYH